MNKRFARYVNSGKMIRMNVAKVVAASILGLTVGIASSQVTIRRHPLNVNTNAMAALQSDLASAIANMDKALPIYDGYRVKSMRQARQALVVVDKFMYGRTATARPIVSARDSVMSSRAKSMYKGQEIGASQQQMRLGLQFLNSAMNDLNNATGGHLQKRGVKVSADISKAISDANTAIGLQGGQA